MTTMTTPPTTMISGGSPTIFVTTLDSAVRFYAETLGLKLHYRAGEHFAMIDAGGGLMLGLHPPGKLTPTPGTPGSIQIGLNVSQPIETVVKTLVGHGVRFQEIDGNPIVDDQSVKLAFFSDPDGNEFYLCELKK